MGEVLHNENVDFDTPKPVKLIKHILSIATQPSGNEVILDFFGVAELLPTQFLI